jgi:formylglycine-generating enzyme required for sulfatase activity
MRALILSFIVIIPALAVRAAPAPVRPSKEVTNSLGMKLVFIPAGRFVMGSPGDEKGRQRCEGPQHEVQITRAFYLGAHAVTQGQYKKVMGSNPSHYSAGGAGKRKVRGLDTRDFPVEMVSWNEAVKFCARLSALPAERRAGRVYRLPSEGEWEYACRAGTTTPFSFGKSANSTQANFDGNHPYGAAGPGPHLGRTTKVGSYKPNKFGLFDMHGNVYQWCSDWFKDDYYKESPRKDPRGPGLSVLRAMRGGCCHAIGGCCRAAYRSEGRPDSRYGVVGLRVACRIPTGR